MDVSDRGLQAKLTQEAKITSACFLSEVIFAFGGFVNALSPDGMPSGPLSRRKTLFFDGKGAERLKISRFSGRRSGRVCIFLRKRKRLLPKNAKTDVHAASFD